MKNLQKILTNDLQGGIIKIDVTNNKLLSNQIIDEFIYTLAKGIVNPYIEKGFKAPIFVNNTDNTMTIKNNKNKYIYIIQINH